MIKVQRNVPLTNDIEGASRLCETMEALYEVNICILTSVTDTDTFADGKVVR